MEWSRLFPRSLFPSRNQKLNPFINLSACTVLIKRTFCIAGRRIAEPAMTKEIHSES